MMWSKADGFVIAFNITNRQTFENARSWFTTVGDNCGKRVRPTTILVGTMLDDKQYRCVSEEEAGKLAAEFGVRYFEVSAKTGEGVQKAFFTLASQILKHQAEEEAKRSAAEAVTAQPPTAPQRASRTSFFSKLFSRKK
jgi:GTPase SAR1 family protein